DGGGGDGALRGGHWSPRAALHPPALGAAHRSKEFAVPGLLFGLNVSTSAAPGADPVAAARAAEALGFDFVSASDHPAGTQPPYETWTMLAWIAAGTSTIRVATRVLGVPFRSPAM